MPFQHTPMHPNELQHFLTNSNTSQPTPTHTNSYCQKPPLSANTNVGPIWTPCAYVRLIIYYLFIHLSLPPFQFSHDFYSHVFHSHYVLIVVQYGYTHSTLATDAEHWQPLNMGLDCSSYFRFVIN